MAAQPPSLLARLKRRLARLAGVQAAPKAKAKTKAAPKAKSVPAEIPATAAARKPAPSPTAKPAAPAPAASTPAAAPGGTKQGNRGSYWRRRQNMMYYHYVRAMSQRLAAGAGSLIDVGSHSTSIAEEFDWIGHRVALDLGTPYSSDKVIGVQANFLTYVPDRKFDFALCLQVLEHIPEVEAFARKLLEVSDRVLVSVPYKWPVGSHREHVQDPVDEKKLAAWFGRVPDYQLVVEEPLHGTKTGRRLIAYFHTPGEKLDLIALRKQHQQGSRPAAPKSTPKSEPKPAAKAAPLAVDA